jgi:Anti-sigma factor NepR
MVRNDHTRSGAEPTRASATMDVEARRRLGLALRTMYSNLERETLPQRLRDLLDKFAERREDEYRKP